jgi:hypothetical protein
MIRFNYLFGARPMLVYRQCARLASTTDARIGGASPALLPPRPTNRAFLPGCHANVASSRPAVVRSSFADARSERVRYGGAKWM